MRVDTDEYVDRCVKCAQHKGTVLRPAPILEYPPPDRPWDVVSLDLLQLPASHQGSRYLLVCVDHLSRYVVLAPVKDKSAISVAHALITHLIWLAYVAASINSRVWSPRDSLPTI